MTRRGSLVVSEVFGPTIQGEGPSAGRLAAFIRLGGCNLHCGWCDTPYTWDATRFDLRKEMTRAAAEGIVKQVVDMKAPLAVITGGEPLLHQNQPGWVDLLDGLAKAGIAVEVETNGTVVPTDVTTRAARRFVSSPKLAHAGDPADKRIRTDAITALVAAGADFKFVITDKADLDEVADFARRGVIPDDSIWLMPEGTDPETVVERGRWLAEEAVQRRWNFTSRLHVLAWGDARGH